MTPFLYVFTLLILRMLIVCGDSEDSTLPSLNNSLISGNNSATEDTFSSLLTNSLILQNTSSLSNNSRSLSVEDSNSTGNTSEGILDCRNITWSAEAFSKRFQDLNSSLYVRKGDSVIFCRHVWLQKFLEDCGTVAGAYTMSIVIGIHFLIAIAFLRGRKSLVGASLAFFVISLPLFLPIDFNSGGFYPKVNIIICIANFIIMSFFLWVSIFTRFPVLEYLHAKGYIEFTEYSANHYNIDILSGTYVLKTGWILGFVLGGLTFLLSLMKNGERHLAIGDTDQLHLYTFLFEFPPIYLLIVIICLALYIMTIISLMNSIWKSEIPIIPEEFWLALLRECYFLIFLYMIFGCWVVLNLQALLNIPVNFIIYAFSVLSASMAAIGFYILFRSFSESAYEADANLQPPIMFRFTLKKKFICTWTVGRKPTETFRI